MDTEAPNTPDYTAELRSTLRIAGNALALLQTETTVKGELALVLSESITWLSNMKKIIVERINALEKDEEALKGRDQLKNVK